MGAQSGHLAKLRGVMSPQLNALRRPPATALPHPPSVRRRQILRLVRAPVHADSPRESANSCRRDGASLHTLARPPECTAQTPVDRRGICSAQNRTRSPRDTSSGRAGVPRPAAAADMRRRAVDVRGDHVWLDAIDFELRAAMSPPGSDSASRTVRRRWVPFALQRQRLNHPQRRVRVLAAVFANSGRIALDVTGVERRLVERRRRAAAPADRRVTNQVLRQPTRMAMRDARDRRPRLPTKIARANRSGIRRSLRTERRAVVEDTRGDTICHPRRVAPPLAASARLGRDTTRPLGSHRRALSTNGRNRSSTTRRNQASQTLSPCPSTPTRFMPSFQSPQPINGKP